MFSAEILVTYIFGMVKTLLKFNNVNGTPGNYISFKPYDNTTILKGDGANILRVTNSSYLRIEGFEIYGEVNNIPLSTALDLQFLWDSLGTVVYRVPPGTSDSEIENMSFSILGSVSKTIIY